MKQKIIDWYNGRPPTKEERLTEFRQSSGIPSKPQQEYHWTALVVRWAVKEYKWIVGTAVAIGGLYVAYLALKK